jgi:cytochrome P450
MATSSRRMRSFSETHGTFLFLRRVVDGPTHVAFPFFRAILHDDRLFSDPFTFKPERFIGSDVDPRVPAAVDYAFGFGRRVCPGRWMAHAFVWVVVASVLSSFRIEKVVRDGRVIEPTGAFSPGILACVFSPGRRCSLCP